MSIVQYKGAAHEVAPGETILEALLRGGASIPNACRAGSCQSCLLQADAPPPAHAQRGLKDTLAAQNYFLSCLCKPDGDMRVADRADAVPAMIEECRHFTDSVLRVRLRTLEPFSYRAGQYLALRRADGLVRNYSIASLPEEGILELHIRRTPNGQMSNWLFDHVQSGERVAVAGPSGNCFYVPGDRTRPLLLAGTGTGLAPLAGILKDALLHQHEGAIYLYHGAVRPSGLYMTDTLLGLQQQYPHFRYHPVVLDDDTRSGVRCGALDQSIVSDLRSLKGWRAYLCGDPAIVNLLRKKIFLAGAASSDIFADPFTPSCN
jgi:NAD(P)H-flavin reductase